MRDVPCRGRPYARADQSDLVAFDPAAFDRKAFGADWSAGRRRGADAELRGWLELALSCCDEADAIARRHFRRDVAVSAKPDRSLVTAADTAIEAAIRERIRARHPDHGLVGEEFGVDEGRASVRWYIDPIDGTHNFVRGIPIFGTLLGVERDGETQVGVLSAPALGERWFAWRGGGAWVVRAGASVGRESGGSDGSGEPRRIEVSRVERIEEAQLLFGSPADIERTGRAPGFAALLRRSWRDRGFGDFWAYALLAEGAAEAMIEVELSSWDLAAPQVLVEEAGGRMTDWSGVRTIHAPTLLASNGLLHAELLAALREAPAGSGGMA